MARTKKGYAGIVSWSADPSCAMHLLNWLDDHLKECQAFFDSHNYGGNKYKGTHTLLKKTCLQWAAFNIFSNDRDEMIKEQLHGNLLCLGQAVADFMET